MTRSLIDEITRSIEEYLQTGKFVIAEGYRRDHSDDWRGGFYLLTIFILFMISILPVAIILDIFKIPLYLFGKLIICIYKVIKGE